MVRGADAAAAPVVVVVCQNQILDFGMLQGVKKVQLLKRKRW